MASHLLKPITFQDCQINSMPGMVLTVYFAGRQKTVIQSFTSDRQTDRQTDSCCILPIQAHLWPLPARYMNVAQLLQCKPSNAKVRTVSTMDYTNTNKQITTSQPLTTQFKRCPCHVDRNPKSGLRLRKLPVVGATRLTPSWPTG